MMVMSRKFHLILWMLVCLPLVGAAAEIKVVAGVRFGIFDSPVSWNEELKDCSSRAVLKPAAELLGVSVAELRKLVSVDGLIESNELAITVRHEDAEKAWAVADNIRKEYEKAKIADEVALFKKAQSFEARRMELNYQYAVARAEAQKEYYLSLYNREDGEPVPIFEKYLKDNSIFLARSTAFKDGMKKLDEEKAEFAKSIRQGGLNDSASEEDLPVGPTLEQDRMTYEKAKAAAEEAEKE